MAGEQRLDIDDTRGGGDGEAHPVARCALNQLGHPVAQLDCFAAQKPSVDAGLGVVQIGDARLESSAGSSIEVEDVDVGPNSLAAARDREQLTVLACIPLPGEAVCFEGAVEGGAVYLLGIRERSVDIEDERLRCHPNTRLARRSALSMVIRSSRVSARPACAKSRVACLRRARSRALRMERAFAKCGCRMRSGMYSRSASRAEALSLYCMPSSMRAAMASSSTAV